MIGLRIGNEDKRLNVEVYFFQPLFYIPLRCIPLLLSKLCWGIFSKTYPSFLTLKEGVFSKITPSLFVDKASCTRQFESELSLHSLASLFPLKEGSTSHLGLLPSGKKRETALLGARNRYALRLADQSGLRHILRAGTAWE